ncbi:RIP metalloprotease RseP [Patescibacteria group bacterium]|nr:RIP metalloprotease RseP [Patescibacteria group bacterium]
MFVAIIAFIVVFTLVILVHELGHFYFAKRSGVRVEEFGFGMPPRIWGIKKNGTIYSINWIPFGGFVRLYGESANEKAGKHSLISKSPGARFWVMGGGILMNFALAWVLLMVGFWLSMPPMIGPVEDYAPDTQVQGKVMVLQVADKSPAQAAQLQPGDYILSVDGVTANSPAEFKSLLADKSGNTVELQIERANEQIAVSVEPTVTPDGVVIGAWIDRAIQQVRYVWWQVPWIALQETWRIILVVVMAVVGLIYKLFTTASIPPELAGPVGIARITADLVQLGALRMLQFVIFLSINLGILNLVPFPGLDGGRLLFIGLEVVRGGKKISQRVEGVVHTIGFALLMLLILAVTYKDILKWI